MKLSRGSTTVELVIMTPVLIILVLLVLMTGRGAQLSTRVHHAADVGARSASVVSFEFMDAEAKAAVARDLSRNSVDCLKLSVNTNVLKDSKTRSVTVEVKCLLSKRDVMMLMPIDRTFSARSTEVIDKYRAN